MQGGERYNSISDYLKDEFGTKTVKLSIDAGFTCPNRDGTIAYGGCTFCSAGGSGELASKGSISKAIQEQIDINEKKWPNATYIAYFQAHTNTYAPVEVLREKYYEAIKNPNISGIVIATRPDCINNDVLALLEEINQNHFMWIELGLQTIHEKTSNLLNIGYTLEKYDKAVEELSKRSIKIVTHLILGLPGETYEEMFQSVNYVCQKPIFGLKLHLLNVVKGSKLYKTNPEYTSFESIDEYVDFVVNLLEIIPENITIHRLTGDVPRNLLVSPEWSYKKRTILNKINKELKDRNTFQGRKCK